MHKASDLGGNIYKSRSGSKFLKFRARLLRSSFLPSRRKNSVFTSGGESSRFRRTIMQRAPFTSHVTTSLKRLFPSRISNHYSNSWSQHCNGAPRDITLPSPPIDLAWSRLSLDPFQFCHNYDTFEGTIPCTNQIIR